MLSYSATPLGPFGATFGRNSVKELSDTTCEVLVEMSFDLRFGLLGKLLYYAMMRAKLNKGLDAGSDALKTRIETGQLVRKRRAAPGTPLLGTATA